MSRRFAILAMMLAIAISCVLWAALCTESSQTNAPHQVTALPRDDVLRRFRQAHEREDSGDFEKWALEISFRRLLEGLTLEEIKESLGSPSFMRRVPRDPGEDPSFGISRLLQAKVDYWCYGIYDPATNRAWNFALGIESPLLKDRTLLWSRYTHGVRGIKLLEEVFVDYCGEFREYEKLRSKND